MNRIFMKIFVILLLSAAVPLVLLGQSQKTKTISKAEYFIDADPGEGNGTALTVSQQGADFVVTQDIQLSGLHVGAHFLYIRYYDTERGWGPARGVYFKVSFGPPAENALAAAEYFIDTDPGKGNGTAIDAPLDGSYDGLLEEIEISPVTPAVGPHTLFVRFKDKNGRWSPARGVHFTVSDQEQAAKYIAAAEYFLDNDPGAGKGTPVELPADGAFDEAEEEFNLDVALANIREDDHFVYLRTKSSDGRWGPARGVYFIASSKAPPVIAGAEYFFDTDPGQGNATPLPALDGSYNALEEDGQIEVPVSAEGLSEGNHTAFVRFKTSWDDWSAPKSKTFNVVALPVIEVSKSSLDFGQVVIGTSAQQQFAIRNSGDDTLHVTNIYLENTNLGYSLQPASGTIPPYSNDSIVVTVTFEAAEPAGVKNTAITIENNALQKKVTVSGEAIINPTPTISVNITELDFKAVEAGKDSSITFQISNLGTQSLEISNIHSGNSIFEVVEPASFPQSVALGSPKDVTVKFSPTELTEYNGNLRITSNDPNNGTLNLEMRGEGTSGPPRRLIVAEPDTLDFGLVTKDSTVERVITIANEGNAILHIREINSDNGVFRVINPPTPQDPLSIVAASSENVLIRFTPDAVVNYSGNISIVSDATDFERKNIFVKGQGVSGPTPNISLSVSSLNYGQLKVNTSKQLSFIIQNQGNAELNVNNMSTGNSVFEITSAKSFNLAPDQQQEVSVSFTPTAATTYQSNLTIYSNIDPVQLSLRGSGAELAVDYDPAAIGTNIEAGQAVTVTIEATASLGASGYARLFYKQGGAAEYDSLAMNNVSANFYSAAIPPQVVGLRGVSYWFKISDGEDVKTAPAENPQSNPFTIIVTAPEGITKVQDQPAGEEQTSYRMISLPVQVADGSPAVVLQNFGAVDIDKWRLFRWQSGKYVESSESGFQNFAPGRGYWFITSVIGKITTGSCSTVPTDQNFSIDLQPGWNMIGDPFNFSVDWSDVLKSANVGVLYSYNGADYEIKNNLEPWEGYFINNSSNNPETIEIKPVESGARQNDGVLAKLPFAQQDYINWSLRIQAGSGMVADRFNFIGEAESAARGRDLFDIVESPRQPGEYLKLYFPHKNWPEHAADYAFDFRAQSEQGNYWDFEVLTTSSAEQVELDFSDYFDIPTDRQIILVDKDLKTAQDLRKCDRYSFKTAQGKELKRSFRLLVGQSQFVRGNNLGVGLVLQHFAVSQNFPNPFNGTTSIKYSLPQDATVQIAVYNLLGQKVKTLLNKEVKAGYHFVSWSGLNEQNNEISSGMYFYVVRVRNVKTGELSLHKISKMVLLK